MRCLRRTKVAAAAIGYGIPKVLPTFHLDPLALDGVGVVDSDSRVVEGDLADLLPGLFSLMQTMSDQGMGMFIEHGDILL